MDTLKPTRRWFCPTPGRLVLGLLVVECLLWLSERFQWFAFNSHKGWTVLIAVAVVGNVTLVMLLWFIDSLIFRWRFQFSIRSLLVLTMAVALPCSWLADQMKKATEQQGLVAEIQKLGGMVLYSHQVDASGNRVSGGQPPEPVWLRKLVGDDFFTNVPFVYLSGSTVTDAHLGHLKRFTVLNFLCLGSGGTPITDVGLQHLKGLTSLKELFLDESYVTDAGLQHLAGLTNLKLLALWDTRVTDAGVKKLQQALPKCDILH